ncbi:MAG TPA: hypothetical protein VMF58_17420 [Rhizomicrobium sp.]|nr:hypothetical protein [Rhizomicrobium sp.]
MNRIAFTIASFALVAAAAFAKAPVARAVAQTYTPLFETASPLQFGQLFSAGIADKRVLVGTRPLVWSPQGRPPQPGVFNLYYFPAYSFHGRLFPQYDIAWLYDQHPDWIMYRNDRSTIVDNGRVTNPIVDVQNPAVFSFIVSLIESRYEGFQGVALDNVTPYNAFEQAGHYAGTHTPCVPASRPACGGTWVQEYRGNRYNDPAWSTALYNLVQRYRATFAQTGRPILPNVANPNNSNLGVLICKSAGGCLEEAWPENGCTTIPNNRLNGKYVDKVWQTRYMQAVSVSWWFAPAYLCGHGASGITQDEISWNSANWLLEAVNLHTAYFSADMKGAKTFANYPASMNPPVGPYSDAPPSPESCGGTGVGTDRGVCVRKYYSNPDRTVVNGIIVVNSSGENRQNYLVPTSTAGWTDQFCERIPTGNYALAPATAVVLVSANADGSCRARLR